MKKPEVQRLPEGRAAGATFQQYAHQWTRGHHGPTSGELPVDRRDLDGMQKLSIAIILRAVEDVIEDGADRADGLRFLRSNDLANWFQVAGIERFTGYSPFKDMSDEELVGLLRERGGGLLTAQARAA